MALRAALVLLFVCTAVQATPNVLNGNDHADNFISPAINTVLGSGHVDTDIFVDYDPGVTIVGTLINDSTNGSLSFKSVNHGTTANHAPYTVLNLSYCCYTPLNDLDEYGALLANATVFTNPLAKAVGGALPVGTGPPVVFVSSSSQNSTDGGSGWGIEFGLSSNYLGLTTSSDSATSAGLAGMLAALSFNHPTWNWFDIKAALRQTAGNWATGWSSTTYGYGFINWSSANGLSSPSAFYLQPPGINIIVHQSYAQVTLLPYRQTRRSFEVIYSVNPAYSWPVKNEYTSTDIAASGGTLLYTSNGTDVTPIFNYFPASSGTTTLIAFTADGLGNFSRVEAFSPNSVTITVTGVCRK